MQLPSPALPCLADDQQDLKKGQAPGVALDSGVTLVEADVFHITPFPCNAVSC